MSLSIRPSIASGPHLDVSEIARKPDYDSITAGTFNSRVTMPLEFLKRPCSAEAGNIEGKWRSKEGNEIFDVK